MLKRAAALAAGLILGGCARLQNHHTPLAPGLPDHQPSKWKFAIAPYFFATGLTGDVGLFGLPTVDVDLTFSDIMDHLDFGAMGIAEARKGRYSIVGDAMYSKISAAKGTPRGVVATDVGVASETFAGFIGGGYSVIADSSGNLDVSLGMRVWSMDTDISFTGGALDGVRRSDGATWVDGLAGVRGNYRLSRVFHVLGWGLIGGGGANLDWDVAAAGGYRFNDRLSAVLGYRALGVDFDNDNIVFDVVEQGPILGLAIRF
jgi:hypothetical protein